MAVRWDVESVAAELLACEDERRDREPFTDEWPELDLDTGDAVQDRTLQLRLDRGERPIGITLGLTSRAKQQRMGCTSRSSPGSPTRWSSRWATRCRRPGSSTRRIEPEIVFVMGDRLEGPGVTAATAMAAVESVWGGAEVIDSRYRDFRFTTGDVAADNASSGAFVTGPGLVVFSGGMTDAVFAPPGDSVGLHFTTLGSVFLRGGEA